MYHLEREIGVHGFHGVVSLHTAKNSTQFLATCSSPIMEKSLVEPALEATRRFNSSPTEVTFEKREDIPPFFLTKTDELCPVPFEVNLGIPRWLTNCLRCVMGCSSKIETGQGFSNFTQLRSLILKPT